MSEDVKPTIYPFLRYDDAAAALDWLERAFGFRKTMEVPGPDGTIVHAQISFGTGVVMLASAKAAATAQEPGDVVTARRASMSRSRTRMRTASVRRPREQ
jgi:uncharacterized glyoxalase superfamily protein PhnB